MFIFEQLINELNKLRNENQEAEVTIQNNEREIESLLNELKRKDENILELVQSKFIF